MLGARAARKMRPRGPCGWQCDFHFGHPCRWAPFVGERCPGARVSHIVCSVKQAHGPVVSQDDTTHGPGLASVITSFGILPAISSGRVMAAGSLLFIIIIRLLPTSQRK